MGRGTKFKPEEIIAKLREAEVELARGKKIPEVCKQLNEVLSSRVDAILIRANLGFQADNELPLLE